jgi:hypothetical protein
MQARGGWKREQHQLTSAMRISEAQAQGKVGAALGSGADRGGAKRAAAEAAQVAAAKRQKLTRAAAASGMFGSGKMTKKDQKFVEDVAKVLEKVVEKVGKGIEAEVCCRTRLEHEACHVNWV